MLFLNAIVGRLYDINYSYLVYLIINAIFLALKLVIKNQFKNVNLSDINNIKGFYIFIV